MLTLFRPKNLLFLAICQWLMYYAVVEPILAKYGLPTMLPTYLVLVLILATVAICAGGYVINDYFDIKIDRINCPNRVVIGEKVSKSTAMKIYVAISSIGILLGVTVALLVGSMSLGFIFIVVPGMLWFYSSSYKRQFLIGNFIVSLLCALSILLPLIAETAMLEATYGELLRQTLILKQLYTWVGGYAIFAFIVTLIREIVKDIEDIEGDRQMECRTLPVVWGANQAKNFATTIFAISMISMFVIDKFWIKLPEQSFFRFFSPTLIFIVFFALYLSFMHLNRKEVDYHKVSSLLKIFMAVGVFYSLVFYYSLAQTYHLTIFGLFKVA